MGIYPWQESEWNTLNVQFTNDRLAHALLFHGPDGIGKQDFVRAFVARLFCQNPDNNQACGVCESCHLLAVGNHPDLRSIACEEDKKNISVDQIRELIDYVSLMPHSSRYKVAVIDQAELMSVNAANSLLKTLEEPPKSALIFLVTHKPERLLPTILSRCQKITLKQPALSEANAWLSQTIADTDRRNALLALANGAPLKALAYHEQNLIEQRQLQFDSLLNLTNGQIDPVSTAEKWAKLDLEISLQSLMSWISDLCRLEISQIPDIVNIDIQQELKALKAKTSLKQLVEYQQYLIQCMELSSSNVNIQLLLEDILIHWVKLFHYKEAV